MISVYPYQTREVRDLAWACFSPPLLHSAELAGAGANLSNCALGLTDARRAWLERLDRDAGPLLAHLAERPGARLGIYFERLWHFFLAEDPAVDLLAHNLPVREDGRTIGEFDCLYYCRDRRRPVHLELAVKYYLGYRDDALWSAGAWLGPDSRDRLDLKVAHLMGSQIRLGDHPAARAELQRLGISGLAKEVEMKGDLFQPRCAPLPPPRGFNRDRRFSYWLRFAGLAEHLDSLDCNRFFVLPRLSWLAPSVTTPQECDNRASLLRRLDRHFSVHRQPQLVATLGPDGRECERFFVTDSRWPDPQQA